MYLHRKHKGLHAYLWEIRAQYRNMTLNVPFTKMVNGSAWTRSGIQALQALNAEALNAIIYANIQQPNVSSHNVVPEVGYINRYEYNPNVTLYKDRGDNILEQGNKSCYEIRYVLFKL